MLYCGQEQASFKTVAFLKQEKLPVIAECKQYPAVSQNIVVGSWVFLDKLPGGVSHCPEEAEDITASFVAGRDTVQKILKGPCRITDYIIRSNLLTSIRLYGRGLPIVSENPVLTFELKDKRVSMTFIYRTAGS